jgi:hypothetical protein
LGILAGAVRDRNEWLIVLLGTKNEGGLHIIVDDFYVPPTQHRTGAHCKPYREDLPDPDEYFPPHVMSRMVGALHSHNNMGARFSGGDLAKDGLCSTFSMNIVIGSSVKSNDEESYYLGFEYQAELHFDLPCGGIGICEAKIVPRGEEDWPLDWGIDRPWITENSISRVTIKRDHEDLGDCEEYVESSDSDRFMYKRDSRCGLVETVPNRRYSIFGSNGRPILTRLPKAYEPPKKEKKDSGNVVSIEDYYESVYMDRYLDYAREYEGYNK